MRGTTRPLWAAALWAAQVAAQDVTPPPGAVLLDLELTVDNTPTRLRLHQDQSFLDAARQACTPTETPEAKDNCVGGAMSIIVNQHLRASTVHKSKLAALSTRPRCSHRATWPARPHRRRERQHPSHWLICTQAAKDGQAADATALASPGVSLVRDDLEKYDPVSWVGQSPLHVDIELPIQVKRTVCDAERCFELGDDDGVPPENHTLQVPAWSSNLTETAREVAAALDLWREMDLTLVEHRVALERTRKATPLDQRLHRAHDSSPVVSFDGFYPVYFVLHNGALFFDAQRVKVSGAFRPPIDGEVCIAVTSLGEGNADVNPPAEAAGEACFADTYNAVLTGFEQAKGSHRLTARLRRKDTDATVGEGDFSTFVAAPPLRPTTPWDSPQGRFIKLLRDAVVGWLYLDNVNPDDPGLAGPCTTGWNGRAQCQMPITPSTRYHPTHRSICAQATPWSACTSSIGSKQ